MKIDIREAGEFDIGKILEIYSQPSIDNGAVLTTEEAGEIFKTIKSYPNYKIYAMGRTRNAIAHRKLCLYSKEELIESENGEHISLEEFQKRALLLLKLTKSAVIYTTLKQ